MATHFMTHNTSGTSLQTWVRCFLVSLVLFSNEMFLYLLLFGVKLSSATVFAQHTISQRLLTQEQNLGVLFLFVCLFDRRRLVL